MALMQSLTIAAAIFSNAFCWVKEMENLNLFEGDMVLRPDQINKWNNGQLGYGSKRDKNELWPNGIVPYTISYELSSNRKAMGAINAAFDEYKKYTCIRFQKKSSRDRQYVHFHKGSGCSSWVGRDIYVRGGKHPISLDDGCWSKATVIHEMAHSLGFYHEQSRPDRDAHIEVLYNNMPSGAASQFKKQPYSNVDSLGTPYDFESIMHYNWNAFGHYRKGADFALQTIRTKDPSKQWLLGQRDGFSKVDVIQINKLYSCGSNYPLPPSSSTLPTDACHDKGSCADGKAEGHCTQRQWQSWMHKACRFSCGFCKGKPNPDGGVVPPTRGPPVTDGPSKTTLPPPANCDNKESECVGWARSGYCTNPKEARYMRDHCCKACKEDAICIQDQHHRCQEWANRGECKINPRYMLRNCKRACKFCT